MTGCYFHFGQSVWRNLQTEGKSASYIENVDFAMRVREMMALSFVPETDLIDALKQLTTQDKFRELDFLIDYFKDYYVGRQRRGRQTQSRYPITLWNQYKLVTHELPRSNNAAEAWHNSFNGCVNVAHPSVDRLARKLQQEQHSTAILRQQHAVGQPPAKKRKMYVRINDAIRTMIFGYDRNDCLTYLSNLARVVNINACEL